MKTKTDVSGSFTSRALAPVWLALALPVSAAQAGAKPPIEGYDRPMSSRVCGLVLLSEGRSEARAAKSTGSQDKAKAAASIARLVKAFSLLADGRQTDLNAARAASASLLGTARKPAPDRAFAVDRCEAWGTARYPQADFDKSESARGSWASQAKWTFDTE